MAESHTQNVKQKGHSQKYTYCTFPFMKSSQISKTNYSENDNLWWVIN